MIWFLLSRSDMRDCLVGVICVVICWFMGWVFVCIYGVMFLREVYFYFYGLYYIWIVLY